MEKKILCCILVVGIFVNILKLCGLGVVDFEVEDREIEIVLDEPLEAEVVQVDFSEDLKGKVVIIDAGHCKNADNVYMGYSEAATMLALSLELKSMLEGKGAKVYLIRPTDESVVLPVRAARINLLSLEFLEKDDSLTPGELQEIIELKKGMQKVIDDSENYASVYFNIPWKRDNQIHPDLERIFELQGGDRIRDNILMLSLHSNAIGEPIDKSVNGADMYVTTTGITYGYAEYTNEDKSRLFGEIVLQYISKLGMRSRQVLEGNWFIIREHNLPGLLAENGYHTSDEDRGKLLSDFFINRLAKVYTVAVVEYFNGSLLGGW